MLSNRLASILFPLLASRNNNVLVYKFFSSISAFKKSMVEFNLSMLEIKVVFTVCMNLAEKCSYHLLYQPLHPVI